MRFKFTIILVILNLLALAYLYLLEGRRGPLSEFEQVSRQFFPIGLDIDKIEIDIDGESLKETRVIKRERDHWEIVEPFYWQANESAVQRILSQLQFLQKEVVIPLKELKQSKQSLADFGLEDPAIILTLWSGTKKTELKIGKTTKLGSRLYVLSPDGRDVVVVDGSLLESLDISLKNLRKPQIFDIPVFEIKSFRVQKGERRILLEKSGHQWRFAAPISVPADNMLVNNALGLLVAAKAESIIPAKDVNRQQMGLERPFMRLALSSKQRREVLAIGGHVAQAKEAGQQRYAMLESGENEGTVMVIDADEFEWLLGATDELRERKFMKFKPAQVTSIEIKQGGKELKLQRLEKNRVTPDTHWQVRRIETDGASNPIAGDTKVISKLLTNLKDLEAQQFVSDASSSAAQDKYGFDQPNAAVEIGAETNKTLLIGSVVPENQRLVYAKIKGEPYIYAIWSRILADLTANPLHFRDRTLLEQPNAAKIVRMTITDLENDKALIDESIDVKQTTWPVALQQYSSKQQDALLGILDAAQAFEVQHYLSEEFAPIKNLPWRYHLQVESVLPGGENEQNKTLDFYFTFRVRAERQVGGNPQANANFTLTQEFIDDLFAVTFEMEEPRMPADAEQVESVDVELLDSTPPPSGPLPGAFLPNYETHQTQQNSPQ